MKKNFFVTVLLVCMALIISLTGCETKEPEPEPYTKMIESINREDLTHARKYANLVIQDFPDTDYVYNAYLIKNMIVASELWLDWNKNKLLSNGIDNASVGLLEQADIDLLEEYTKELKGKMEDLDKQFYKTTIYLLEHYENVDKVKISFPETTENEVFSVDRDLQELKFFSDVGYPVPTRAEMYANDTENIVKIFRQFRNGENGEVPFSYDRYFTYLTSVCIDDSLLEKIFNKIIDITEDDKYNEYRLDAEEYLEEYLKENK